MCNPRRIRVRASRQLSEAWRAEVTRTAQASGTAVGEARIIQQLGRSLPAPVRARLLELLRDDETWRPVGNALRRDMAGGYIEYHPSTGEVEIVARVSAEFSVEGTAHLVREGVAEGSHESEAEVVYYNDGYGGRTKQVAKAEGERTAGNEAELHARAAAAAAAQAAQAQAEQELLAGIDEEARARALAMMEDERRRRQAEAEQEAALRAQTFQQDYLREINMPLANAYRDILVAHARHAGAAHLQVHQDGDNIYIQFEQREA